MTPERFAPHDPVRLPEGFRCGARNCGIKPDQPDLALFFADRPGSAAGLLTRNHFPGAPILLARERLSAGRLQAIVVNSGNSNVATGERGIADARRMAEATGRELGIAPELVLVGSTGVIGRPLPIERIEGGIEGMGGAAGVDPMEGARGIMTTDRVPKAFSVDMGGATLTAIGKGAGMIAPNLATMLVYFLTDAEMEPGVLDRLLRRAADDSFQTLSVDTDTSTSDMVIALASGRAGPVSEAAFGEALSALSMRMAEAVARDGEGATRLLRVRVEGAADRSEARRIARSIAESPLIKTMIYGRDPNVGRILMAIGKCVECRVRPERVRATLQGIEVVRAGRSAEFEDRDIRDALDAPEVRIGVELGVGPGVGSALGCDLTEGYIEENTAYASS